VRSGAEAEAELHRGELAALAGDWDTAIAAFQRSVTLDPTLGIARLSLFEVLVSADREAEAEAMVDELLRIGGADQSVLVEIAGLRERQGRYDDAIALMRRPHVDLGLGSFAYPDYLRILVGAGHWEEAAIEARWAFQAPTLWIETARLARILALLALREYPLARDSLATFDATEYAGIVEDWARQFERSGAIGAIRRILDEASTALPDDATLRAVRRQFGG
jgi:tetratricopeptide (TPR) repeat protein